jgi:DNA-binding transcriptional LysR family regulator
VSRRLRALERDLDIALFHRGTDGYRLTPSGERVLAQAEAMERAALVLGPRAREGTDKLVGRVRVALLEEYATHWLVAALPELRRTHPGIEVQIVTGVAPLDLSRGEADVAIRSGRPRQTALVAVRLPRGSTGLYASRQYVGRRTLRIHDVASAGDHPLAIYVAAHQALQSATWFAPVLAEGNIVITTNSTHTLVAAARSSLAVSVLPRFVARVHDDLVPVSDDLFQDRMWLVMHPDVRRDPNVRAVADFLKRVAVRFADPG